MTRRLIVLVLLVMVLVVGGAVAVVATSRPDLEDSRDKVDERWVALRGPLTTRYDELTQLTDALTAAGAGERTYTVDLLDEVAAWKELAGRADGDAAAEAAAANRLEGLAARIRVDVAGSARLSRDSGVAAALAAFDTALVPGDEVGAYNRAVRRYQSTRTDSLKRVSADLLGYGARPILVIGVTESAG